MISNKHNAIPVHFVMRLTFAYYPNSIMLNGVMTISNITTLIIKLIEFLFPELSARVK